MNQFYIGTAIKVLLIGVLPETIAAYTDEDSEFNRFKTIAVFECRGYSPVETQFTVK